MMRSIKSIQIIATTAAVLFAEHQIAVQGGMVIDFDAVTSETEKVYTEVYPQGTLRYDGRIEATESLSFVPKFYTHAIGGTDAAYSRHYVMPYVFDGDIAARFSKAVHSVAVTVQGMITPGAKAIRFPVIPSDGSEYMGDSLKIRDALGTAAEYDLSFEHVELGGSVLYLKKSYDHIIRNDDNGFYRESDLYFSGNGAVLFMDKQLILGGELFGKNDLNDYDGYNNLSTELYGGTALVLNKRKTQIYSRVAFTDLKGDMIKENGYTTGMGNETNLRISQKVAKGLWLKADMDLLARSETVKSRWGGSLRKAWKTASLEGGYWSTAGSLFPRQCGWASGSFNLIDKHLELEPACKNYWIQNDDSYRYYRTDISMAINVRPLEELRKITLTGGGLWRNFKDAPYFSSGIELFLGVETIL